MPRFRSDEGGRLTGGAAGARRSGSGNPGGSILAIFSLLALVPFGVAAASGAPEGAAASRGSGAYGSEVPAQSGAAVLEAEARPQDPVEAVMVAAGRWALERLPAGPASMDPHRSGAGRDGARVQRVASSLGLDLTTLDQAKHCTDALEPSTCQLSTARLLAIGSPRIEGDRAKVKVYAWYRSGFGAASVAEESWDLTLRRAGDGWQVVSEE